MAEWTKEKYAAYLQTPHWRAFRYTALQSYGYTCQLCRREYRHAQQFINVHHKNYDHLYREKFRDVLVLCVRCHETIHKARRKGISYTRAFLDRGERTALENLQLIEGE